MRLHGFRRDWPNGYLHLVLDGIDFNALDSRVDEILVELRPVYPSFSDHPYHKLKERLQTAKDDLQPLQARVAALQASYGESLAAEDAPDIVDAAYSLLEDAKRSLTVQSDKVATLQKLADEAKREFHRERDAATDRANSEHFNLLQRKLAELGSKLRTVLDPETLAQIVAVSTLLG